jgi:hypothetical protein
MKTLAHHNSNYQKVQIRIIGLIWGHMRSERIALGTLVLLLITTVSCDNQPRQAQHRTSGPIWFGVLQIGKSRPVP